mgnify:CR=1 FL=1
MNILPRFCAYKAILIPCIVFMLSSPRLLGAQEQFSELSVGERTYSRVIVKQVTPEALIIQHASGIARIPLKDLSPEQQAHFGYNPQAASDYKQKVSQQNETMRATAKANFEKRAAQIKASRRLRSGQSAADRVLSQFGAPPKIQKEVDFRPYLKEMELHSKSQGLRPSCSVFSIISAFEYQKAVVDQQSEKLSEEFLIWATRQTLGMNTEKQERLEGEDLGFTLTEVAQALQTYGVPLESDMPYSFKGEDSIQAPPLTVLEKARARIGTITVYRVVGRDTTAQLDNIVHALNEGVPVAIGLRWPSNAKRLWKAPLIDKQEPPENDYHAVTLVGYKTPTGRKEDLVFTFKNSWGPRWGAAGYGYVSYPYLKQHLRTALFIGYR